jgi:hypothetical protein
MSVDDTVDLGSLRPIDVGFDLRALKMPARLKMEPGRTYRIRGDREHVGTPEAICAALAAEGYLVFPAETPNGREVRYVDGRFEVQPANDNYWLATASLAEALDAYEHPAQYR